MRKSLLCLISILAFSFTTYANTKTKDQTPAKKWTFLLFLNGHNNLDEEGYLNINQMESVGSSDQVNMVVQWASMKVASTKRIYIQKDTDMSKVTSPVIEDMGKVDMGDYKSLKDFILWGMHNYPAEHYFVAVWDHGSGWHEFLGTRPRMHIQDISWDDVSGHQITTLQLGQAIREASTEAGRKIDIYGSDACLMQMLEVAAEMKGSIDYYAGSEELEPGDGWPYDKIFGPLVANPDMSPAQLASLMTDAYGADYADGHAGDVTFSALDMSHFGDIENSLTTLATDFASMNKDVQTKVMSSVTDAQSFAYSDYGDLGDFLSLLGQEKELTPYSSHIQTAAAAMSALVIRNATTSAYARAQGVSFWLPKDTDAFNSYNSQYRTLAFAKETGWINGVSAYLKK